MCNDLTFVLTFMTNTSKHWWTTSIEIFYSNEQTPTIFQIVMPITNPIKKIQAQKEIIQQLAKVPNIYTLLLFIINGRKWCQNITNNWWCQGTCHTQKRFYNELLEDQTNFDGQKSKMCRSLLSLLDEFVNQTHWTISLNL